MAAVQGHDLMKRSSVSAGQTVLAVVLLAANLPLLTDVVLSAANLPLMTVGHDCLTSVHLLCCCKRAILI
jgi:hypothetical protein